jgi:hypothetical protein
VARQRSAKPLISGSTPDAASKNIFKNLSFFEKHASSEEGQISNSAFFIWDRCCLCGGGGKLN